ncbi:MAG: GPP34 family phosphoprotein [Acidimicrobiia bacterium]|nr:GPP34 family phosphoprotein [Acidimicrobiia bacterium]
MGDVLRLVEEVTLLLRREEDLAFTHVPTLSLRYGLAGAVLMDLAIENRIDTDLERLAVIDPTPVGDELLDPTLAEIAASDGHDTRHWLEQTAARADEIHAGVLERLIDRGVLERRQRSSKRLFGSVRSEVIDGEARRDVRVRVMSALLGDDIPDPRDVMLVCLADACGAFGELLARGEFADVIPRLEQLRKLELIGRAVFEAIEDSQVAMAASMMHHVV